MLGAELLPACCLKLHGKKNFCSSQAPCLLLRSCVGEGVVNGKRDGREFKDAKGIGKWHCVKSLGKQEKLMVRNRSCNCVSCILEDEENCVNKAWQDEWKEVSICRDGSVATTRQVKHPSLTMTTASHIADLAVKGALWPLLLMTTKCTTSILLRSFF